MSSSGSDLSVEEMFEMSEGSKISTTIANGIGAWFVAILGAAAAGFQEAVNFLFLPFRLFVDVAVASVDSFILTPMGITTDAWEITAGELGVFDIFAGPAGTILAMLGLYIVLRYIALPITSNFLPGLLVDNILWKWLFTTAEEEEEGET